MTSPGSSGCHVIRRRFRETGMFPRRRSTAIDAGKGFKLGARAGEGTLTGALRLFDVGGGIASLPARRHAS
jgi:hypothetical protein